MKKKNKILTFLLSGAMLVSVVSLCACEPTEEKPDPVYYSEFGAVGDGVTDDFAAIIDAHEYANERGLPVAADAGKTYYIGAHAKTAYIRTDTDWGDAQFIIDDSKVSVENRSWNVFEIQSDSDSYRVNLPEGYSLQEGQENIGLTFEKPVMLRIVNDNKKDYIRYGANQNSGSSRQEVILVDEDGNVDVDTPILWDYTEVTKMTAYSVTDEAITVEGGIFTTITNTQTVGTSYYARGIGIKRSNTTVLGVEHYITGEPEAEEDPPADPTPGKSSAPYNGFYAVSSANNVTVKDCVMTGHAAYRWMKPTGWVTQGTYDVKADSSNNVSWIDCTQSNSITDSKYWGVMASNFCKNLKLDGCSFSRFDAHQGVYNTTVKNSVLGNDFNVIGAGTLYVENVTRLSGSQFVQLRADYGSTWEGDVVIKNCTMKTSSKTCSILAADWNDHDFGYTCYLPTTVIIDNFKVEGATTCNVFSSITSSKPSTVANSNNPYVITQEVIIKNDDFGINLTANTSGLFENTILTREQ